MDGARDIFWIKSLNGAISKILFILGSYNFLAYLECVRSYAWSKGHSESDLGSVKNYEVYKKVTKIELYTNGGLQLCCTVTNFWHMFSTYTRFS